MAIPHLVAHRGNMELYPENTLVGIEAALQCGAAYVEFDVQCSGDGKLVVIHDTTLERTTSVSGNVFEMTLEELEAVRAHEPERFSLAFFNEHIPSLGDVVRLLQHYPKTMAFVEIKHQTIEQFGIEAIMPKLFGELEIIHQQCIIISYHYDALKYTADNSDFPIGWVLRDYDEDSHNKAIKLNPEYLIIQHRKVPPKQEPWSGDWHWMVYDVTDPELAIHYSDFNIPLIETRNICSMLEHPLLALDVNNTDV